MTLCPLPQSENNSPVLNVEYHLYWRLFGETSFTVGKYDLYLDTSRVSSSSFSTAAWAPIKKSGRGESLIPLRLLYSTNTLAARNSASFGICSIRTPESMIA